jgi:hypothetical protein
MEVNGLRHKTIEEFEAYHHSIIRAVCEERVGNAQLADVVSAMACDLWDSTRKYAKRAYLNLAFDCCYILLKLTGYPISVVDLQDLALDLCKKPVTVWKTNAKPWWKEERALSDIVRICAPDAEDEILTLLKDIGLYGEEE